MRLIITLLIFSFYAPSCKRKENSKGIIMHEVVSDVAGNEKFDTILNGLGKNYVLNFNEYSKKDMLQFYRKSPGEFYNDSIIYHKAVNDFFNSDSTILNYLFKFKTDSSRCSWIYWHNPYSATLEKWEFTFNKQQGAAILIYDYLQNSETKNRAISSSPTEIKEIINKINLVQLDSLTSSKKEVSITQLSGELKKVFQ